MGNQDVDLGYSCTNDQSPSIQSPSEVFPEIAAELTRIAHTSFNGMTRATAVPENGPDGHKYFFHPRTQRQRPPPPPEHHTTPTEGVPHQDAAVTIPYEVKLTAYLRSHLGHIDRQRSIAAARERETACAEEVDGEEGEEEDEHPAAGLAMLREETARTQQIRAGRQMRASGG
ncbi:hypothetical protein ST47_g3712 [Ascochyta rabiei]|uniref:Uncharacterized protein n=1 Tax=Didymella rabiei TaxID=5454 RepID=A0A163H3S0_DIDRA|nr:hypothetical protein ST47_g3712 [Ascochyta rabiei]